MDVLVELAGEGRDVLHLRNAVFAVADGAGFRRLGLAGCDIGGAGGQGACDDNNDEHESALDFPHCLSSARHARTLVPT